MSHLHTSDDPTVTLLKEQSVKSPLNRGAAPSILWEWFRLNGSMDLSVEWIFIEVVKDNKHIFL